MTDLTIFATVCQEANYVVGKGRNDQIRDFGLYLQSSRRTIWLAYGASNISEGFRHIIVFYNISLADGNCQQLQQSSRSLC